MQDMGHTNTFIRSLSQVPDNLEPYFVFENMYHMEDERFVTQNLVKDLSGKGAMHDDYHVRKIVAKSFQQHPELLKNYARGRID